MYDVMIVGTKENVRVHFKDKLRGLKEQSEESWEVLQTAVNGLLDHMPTVRQGTPSFHNGVMVHVKGDVRPEASDITVRVRSVTVAGV